MTKRSLFSPFDLGAIPSRADLEHGPLNGYSVVLLLVSRATLAAGGPVGKETIEWYVEIAEQFGDHLQLAKVLSDPLRPRPRREALYLALGELVGAGYLSQGVNGFALTTLGEEIRDSLLASPSAPFFATSPLLTRLDPVPAF